MKRSDGALGPFAATAALAVLLTLFAPRPLAAAPAEPPTSARSEWLGLEITPVWAQLNEEPNFRSGSPAAVAVGAGGTLRLFRYRPGPIYWTPIQLGLGVGAPELSVFLHASTEVGGRLPLLDRRLEFGVALGAGAVILTYSGGCDGDCYVGGNPVIASPVLRYFVYDGRRLPLSLFSRAVIPVGGWSEGGSSHTHGFGMVVMFGLDVGLNRL
jgi:hypothetical protein